MTQKEINKLVSDNFNMEDFAILARPKHTVSEMSQGDRIIIEDKLMDYLRDFFDENYKGQKLPKIFDKFLIELRNNPTGLIRIFVEFPDDKKDFIYIDFYINWNHIVKFLFVNVDSDEKDPESGRYITYMTSISFSNNDFTKISQFIKDVVLYAILFVAANKDEKTVYKEEVSKNSIGVKKDKNKKRANPTERKKVFIPKTRRVYKINRITPKVEENLRHYVLSEWPVKGYTYTRRKGKDSAEMIEVTVPSRVSHRKKPNDGVKKEVQGKDYILTQPK